jgi:SAM-dependent methyltransferase
MDDALSLLEGRIGCPDDGAVLLFEGEKYRCPTCARSFAMLEEGFLDLTPVAPSELFGSKIARPYVRYYGGEFKDPVSEAWGTPERNCEGWITRRQRQVEFALPLVSNGQSCASKVLVDFSGGAGYHTIAYARHFKLVLHCDLSSSNLIYARKRARDRRIDNILFVRMDYFRPPFVGGLERVISFDTLCYGADHELRLLSVIYSALSPDGSAVVDFHNWWHNPLRRLGLLRSNYPLIGSYTRRFAERLLAEAGVSRYEYFPFYQELSLKHPLTPILPLFVPPTRLTYRITKPAGPAGA